MKTVNYIGLRETAGILYIGQRNMMGIAGRSFHVEYIRDNSEIRFSDKRFMEDIDNIFKGQIFYEYIPCISWSGVNYIRYKLWR